VVVVHLLYNSLYDEVKVFFLLSVVCCVSWPDWCFRVDDAGSGSHAMTRHVMELRADKIRWHARGGQSLAAKLTMNANKFPGQPDSI